MRHALKQSILCLYILIAAGAVSHAAQPDAVTLLKKSFAAESGSTLTGSMRSTLYSGPTQTTANINVARSGRRMRMEYTSGPSKGVVLVDDGKSVIRLIAALKTAYISDTPEPPERLDLLLANHQPVLAGSAKIAGRDCYILRIQPKHSVNPSKKLWIDKSTSATLKTERYNSEGRLAMSSEYTRVDFRARPASSLFTVPQDWKTVRQSVGSGDMSLEQIRKIVGFTPVRPGYVPAGYSFEGYTSVQSACGRFHFAAMRYSNGMNTLSIFQCKSVNAGPGLGQGRGQGGGQGWRGGRGPGAGAGAGAGRGAGAGGGNFIVADNPSAKMARATVGDLTVVLVGDIAASELQKIAGSFK